MQLVILQHTCQRGFGLLEVVLAIAIFAFGMLALVQLQTNLATSSSDANNRTVAASIAEELLERARGFTQIAADSDNNRMDYDEIVSYDAVDTVRLRDYTGTESGPEYSVHVVVEDHYWDADSESFTDEAPAGIVNSDFKTMDILVMWRAPAAGEDPTDHETIDMREGGALRVVEVVPSSPGLLGALLAAAKESGGTPPVDYHPGSAPDIIRVTLNEEGNRFKESTTANPDVIGKDKTGEADVVETWFDVVTYSQTVGADADFLRREEFVAVACKCQLETTPVAADYGLKPTLWNGVTYTEGEKTDKPIGVEAQGATQSIYCSTCCRDHHDGAGDGEEDVYILNNAGNSSDHPHYSKDNQGNLILTPVEDGETYVEACRLVRKDGFMRVTQDANQGVLLGFPEGYLDFTEAPDIVDGMNNYSSYVRRAASDYYGSQDVTSLPQPGDPGYAEFVVPSGDAFPARDTSDPTDLPTLYLTRSQQMHARAVYTDYLTQAARDVITACFPRQQDGSPQTDSCPAPLASSEMEIYPFFDLQMTKLASWQDNIGNMLIEVISDPLSDNNEHDRGIVNLISDLEGGQAEVLITSHPGNLGLTATTAIEPDYAQVPESVVNSDILFVRTNDSDEAVPAAGFRVSGALRTFNDSSAPVSKLNLSSEVAFCGNNDTTWSCIVPIAGATLSVSGYKNNYACSDLTFSGEAEDGRVTNFALPAGEGSFDIWITNDFAACNR